ncbi:hypothetical protein EDB87DRAFT_1693121 [Lactarius vividus]|nr:hypothetical protein EDB87DRAFT_1693121 [Lactarius vividus]
MPGHPVLPLALRRLPCILLEKLASGLKLGLRQLCSTRYTFGFIGFAVLNSMVDGQALARVGNVSWTRLSDLSFPQWTRSSHIPHLPDSIDEQISFRELKVISWFERVIWIPVILVFIISPCVSGKHFADAPAALPATASQVLNFGATIAGFTITWATISSDYTTYFHPGVSREELVPLSTPSHRPLISKVALQCLDATAAITVPVVPSQEAEYTGGNVGGLIDAMLQPVGKFGKVLMVFVSLSVTGNNVPTIYSFGMCFQTFCKCEFLILLLSHHPVRDIETIVEKDNSTVHCGHELYSALSNFPSIIGYWAGPCAAAVLVEHLYSRAAALTASALSFALVIPSMQLWYSGPIARTTGDIAIWRWRSRHCCISRCVVPKSVGRAFEW